MKNKDPKLYGLSSRDRIVQFTESRWALVIDRKSRIIMADGKRILKKINQIRQTEPDIAMTLLTSAPVCGKTTAFLNANGIDIEFASHLGERQTT